MIFPPKRNYRTVITRPLPESKIRSFGQWLTNQGWDWLGEIADPDEQGDRFEHFMNQKINQYFPLKTTKSP